MSASCPVEEISFPLLGDGRCPYSDYAALRAAAPVHRVPGREEFLVSSREDVLQVLGRPEVFSSALHSVGMRDPGLVAKDPPVHKERRDLAFPLFKPGRLREFTPAIRAIVDELISAFIDDGEVDFLTALAQPLPIRAVSLIMGIPDSDAELLSSWWRTEGVGIQYRSEERKASARVLADELFDYTQNLVLDRRENPGGDGLTMLINAHVEHYGELEIERATADASNLIGGGIVTTAHMLMSIMLLLLRSSDQMERVRADRSLLPALIEEALRIESPVQWVPRWAVADTELGGVRIPKGAQVNVLLGAADRDEHVFNDADAFDVTRPRVKDHVAFGYGRHFCLGAPLARLEGIFAFEALLTRLDNIRLVDDRSQTAPIDSYVFWAPERLVLQFDRATEA